MTLTRRQFSGLLAGAAFGIVGATRRASPAPPRTPFHIYLPGFMRPLISAENIAYLNTTIPLLLHTYRELLFPVLALPPAIVVINTLPDVLIQHGSVVLAPEVVGDEALTLAEAQALLVRTRFGSVATPHRGADVDRFGQLVYLKQHPVTGYRTPHPLLLEELIHVQQDISIMRYIIQQDDLPPQHGLHAHLKGISELAAHFFTDELTGEPDYVFVLDDGTHCETAAQGIALLAARLNTDDATLLRALLYDVPAYAELDARAMDQEGRHIWQMVTTWRHARDETGEVIGIAPAFVDYTDPTTD